MDIFQAIILGAVQGLTEFLPISSSAHLVLVPWALGWPAHGLAFDAALHLGTLSALLLYFWRDWLAVGRAFVLGLTISRERQTFEYALAWMLILGSVPAAVVGFVAQDFIESTVRQPQTIAGVMVLFAIVLLIAERLGVRRRAMERLTMIDALMIGMAQALALVPGVSRSGITITAGLLLGFTRPAAARFSFLLSTPIALAAGSLQLVQLLRTGPDGEALTVLGVGVLTAAVTGLAAITVLLRFLQHNSTDVFVWYRVAAGLCIFLITLVHPG
ncbi:MAG: undecaprenyl-diphosphatase UppP [Chloroflexota bacterium]